MNVIHRTLICVCLCVMVVCMASFIVNKETGDDKRLNIENTLIDEITMEKLFKNLVMEYFKQSKDCPGVEVLTKLKLVSEDGNKVTEDVSVIDSIAYSKKMIQNVDYYFPLRPIINCKDKDDPDSVAYMKSLMHHGKGLDEDKSLSRALQDEGKWKLQRTLSEEVFQDHPGFFVEYRTPKELLDSNTIFLEKERNWTGLLIDPIQTRGDRDAHGEHNKIHIHRGAATIRGCLHEKDENGWIMYSRSELVAPEVHTDARNETREGDDIDQIKIQCLHLETLLHALNRTSVDLLVLNNYGLEAEVLERLPHQRIKVIAVKRHPKREKNIIQIRSLMKDNGYSEKKFEGTQNGVENFDVFIKDEKV